MLSRKIDSWALRPTTGTQHFVSSANNCGSRLTQLAHNTSYPAPDRDNRDHQDYRDVAEPFLKKPEGHPGSPTSPSRSSWHKARHGRLGGLGRPALPLILESGQIQWQSSPQTALSLPPRPTSSSRLSRWSRLSRSATYLGERPNPVAVESPNCV